MQMDLMDRSPKDWWMQSSLQMVCPGLPSSVPPPPHTAMLQQSSHCPTIILLSSQKPSIHATNQKGKIKLGLELARVCNKLSAYINGVSSWIHLETQVPIYYIRQFDTCLFQGSFGFTNSKFQVSGNLTYPNVFLQNPFILPAGVRNLKIRQKVEKMQIYAWGYLCFA